jgi:outer membrane lipoprotein SlyB
MKSASLLALALAAATAHGATVVGGVVGNVIEKEVKKHNVWVSALTMKDGSTRKFEAEAAPDWKAGTEVEVGADNQLKRH